MSRKLVPALVAFLLALTTLAEERGVTRPQQGERRPGLASGASVTGEVGAVSGTLITLAGGLVTIDATNARILDGRGAATIEAIQPGALIAATLQEPGTTSTGPLAATAIAILRNADVTITGTIQSVDVAGSQFLLLGRTIEVDAGTTFVNFGGQGSIASLHANTFVLVEANVADGALVASRVTLIAPIPSRPQHASGVVKSVGTDAWVIAVDHQDTTFVVNASTRILGSPRAGDRVEVLYTVDSAHARVALSIIKSFELPRIVTFTGIVKSIQTPLWVITRDSDKQDVTVDWPLSTRISPVANVGDRVEVVATENADGTYTAIAIVPRWR
ncbi:MAG TPA: DUF5666 domain-containing protein [Thermoanaerobaculia bacterium]|nr:DUF5666 domain-containing protein [Thermoanaerobaculia bacterium]